MQRIGRYEIEREIGRGAMGVVHLARDPRLERPVALKTYSLPAGLSEEAARAFRERFRREARAAASLTHPGLVTVFDAGEDEATGQPFIAMEYVPGRSLRALLESGGRMAPERAAAIAVALAGALQHAHDAGIVHRDIKPANILIRDPDGAAKIADFGVARVATSDLTGSGGSPGSPAYMAPEQVRGGEVDGRADLFALAVVLYEAVTGERPFGGGDPAAVAHAVAYDTPLPASRHVPGLPAGLDRFLERALAKEPAARFPDGRAFGAALTGALADPGAAATWLRPADLPAVPGRAAPGEAPREAAPAAATRVIARGRNAWPSTRGGRLAIAAATLVAAGVGAWLLLGGRAHLRLEGRSTLEAGTLTLTVDGRNVYSRELAAPPPRADFLGKMLPRSAETFEAWIRVPPGKHEVTAQVIPQGGASAWQDVVVVDLDRGETQVLKISAGRSMGEPLSLKTK